MKKRIMIFCDSYLPAYQSGGAMRMIVNLISRFHDRYDFYVVTRNFDSPVDKRPFTSVKTNQWNRIENAQVYYFSADRLNTKFFAEIVAEVKPHALMTNMSYSIPTIVLLRARNKGLVAAIPVIVAACGSLSPGRLAFKSTKKRLFLFYARLTNLYQDVIWKASSESEKCDIKQSIGPKANVIVAVDLCPDVIAPNFDLDKKPKKIPGKVILTYYSRIDRAKNLVYFLERLSEIDEGRIELEIIGPHEHAEYWQKCLAAMKKLGSNVSVTIVGAMQYEDALERLSKSHFFVLPTLSENFGYVIIESLAAGCPNITSNRTVWEDVELKNAGWRIPLESPDEWVKCIRRCIEMDDTEYRPMAASSRNYALEWLAKPDLEEQTANLFRIAFGERERTTTGRNVSRDQNLDRSETQTLGRF